ncbi:MAG: tRNA lysidine(34) synthetase TilS [Prevotellaceae bacterium]|jgi:tRNA(Ile)-lysidine synthase|nr:tRNA lysidine(34) synthetase TilS [Prevotellaceae bacterium]
MLEKITRYIHENNLPQPPAKLIAAVSGGADSVAMLQLLYRLGFNCVVAHCNFTLRGSESDRDEDFVKNLAQSLSLPFFCATFDTRKIAAERGVSIEMAARDLRYEYFEQLRQSECAEAIAVAHHAGDQAETFLMKLVRGAGLRGLTGIKARNGYIIRPLLWASRAEIERFLAANGLAYISDSSNDEEMYTRNRFRHSVIPLLETINPAAKETILATISRLQDAERIYEIGFRQIKSEILTYTKTGVSIYLPRLAETGATKTVLHELLSPYGFSAQQTDDLAVALAEMPSGRQFFSHTHRAVKDRDRLLVSPIDSSSNEIFSIEKNQSALSEPLSLRFEEISSLEGYDLKDKNTAFLDAKKLQFPLHLRRWQAGDSFVPFGMKGRKKLSDYFVDKKYSLPAKKQVWVLLSGNDIVWIVGDRIDNRYRVQADTETVFFVTLSC